MYAPSFPRGLLLGAALPPMGRRTALSFGRDPDDARSRTPARPIAATLVRMDKRVRTPNHIMPRRLRLSASRRRYMRRQLVSYRNAHHAQIARILSLLCNKPSSVLVMPRLWMARLRNACEPWLERELVEEEGI